MTDIGRRGFFKKCFLAGSILAAAETGVTPASVHAAQPAAIKGICFYVPSLGKATDFVEMMNKNAPGDWSVHSLKGSMTERYFTTKRIYQEAKGIANTFVGVVDPGSFVIIHEAIVDSGGSFHYITYEKRDRVTFSVQL